MWFKNNIRQFVLLAPLVALTLIISSCGGDKKESDESETLSFEEYTGPPELVRFELDNGIVAFIQEDPSQTFVCVETSYRAGFIHEPDGQVQISHVVEHAIAEAASAIKAQSGDATLESAVPDPGGVAQANCVRYEYIVMPEVLDATLALEAQLLTSAEFDGASVMEQEQKSVAEIAYALTRGNTAVTRFAIIALCHALRYGRDHVKIYEETLGITSEQIRAFHETYYRPDDMTIVLVGNIDAAEGERLIRKNFESIPRRPAPPAPTVSIASDRTVTWDIDIDAFFLVYPGPYASYRERVALAMVGSYLHRYLSMVPRLQEIAVSIATSSPVYPVAEMPFFIYSQPIQNDFAGDLLQAMEKNVSEALANIDDKIFEAMKRTTKAYMESSQLTGLSTATNAPKALSLEATNIGFRHIFLEGRSDEELYTLIDSITLEEMNEIVDRLLSNSNRRVVTITGLKRK